jgi:hypothetical protein
VPPSELCDISAILPILRSFLKEFPAFQDLSALSRPSNRSQHRTGDIRLLTLLACRLSSVAEFLTESITEAAVRVSIEAYIKRRRIATPVTDRTCTCYCRRSDLLQIFRTLTIARHSTFGLTYRTVFDELAENVLYRRPCIASLLLLSLKSGPAVAAVVTAGQSALVRHAVVFYAVQKTTVDLPSAVTSPDELQHSLFIRALHFVSHALDPPFLHDDYRIHVFPLSASPSRLLCEINHALQDVYVKNQRDAWEVDTRP